MSKTVLNRWMPETLPELPVAIDEIMTEPGCEGSDPALINVDVRDLSLVRGTLTDGSIVFDVVRENH